MASGQLGVIPCEKNQCTQPASVRTRPSSSGVLNSPYWRPMRRYAWRVAPRTARLTWPGSVCVLGR